MPTQYGHFKLIPFRQINTDVEHIALIKGTWEPDEPVLVRVHSSCMTGDIFAFQVCCVDICAPVPYSCKQQFFGVFLSLQIHSSTRLLMITQEMLPHTFTATEKQTVRTGICALEMSRAT